MYRGEEVLAADASALPPALADALVLVHPPYQCLAGSGAILPEKLAATPSRTTSRSVEWCVEAEVSSSWMPASIVWRMTAPSTTSVPEPTTES